VHRILYCINLSYEILIFWSYKLPRALFLGRYVSSSRLWALVLSAHLTWLPPLSKLLSVDCLSASWRRETTSSTILEMCFCRSIKLFSSSKRSATSVPFFSGWYPTCFLSTGRCVGRIILLALMYEAVPLASCDVHSPGCSLFFLSLDCLLAGAGFAGSEAG
jgi:hypothetical protein